MTEHIPLRDDRRICYEARDTFFTCCDKNNIENPMKDQSAVERSCRKQKLRFEQECMSSWVRECYPFNFGLTLTYDVKGGLFHEKKDTR